MGRPAARLAPFQRAEVTDVTLHRPLLAAAVAVLSLASLGGCAGTVIGAGATAGTAAIEERGIEGAIDDTKIRVQINEAWLHQDFEMFRKVGLNIYEGRVMLTGAVANEQARADAVRLTWQAAGVREVYNEIEVVPEGKGFADYSHDAIILQKLNYHLLMDKDIRNVNYIVDVSNGVVYLIGIAQNQAELDRAVAYAKDITNVKRVVSHVYLKSDPRRVSG